jgi:hypothetical protein
VHVAPAAPRPLKARRRPSSSPPRTLRRSLRVIAGSLDRRDRPALGHVPRHRSLRHRRRRRLYFSSTRPRPDAPERTDFDLWYVERDRAGAPWSEPHLFAGSPNDAEDIGFISLDRAGTLYFDAFRDMFRAAPLPGGGFAAPEPIEALKGINPLIAPDGSFLVFSAELADSSSSARPLHLEAKLRERGAPEPRRCLEPSPPDEPANYPFC